jgi:hypothetical protein
MRTRCTGAVGAGAEGITASMARNLFGLPTERTP